MNIKEWDIWMQGYVVTGNSAKASKLGIGYGITFRDAVLEYIENRHKGYPIDDRGTHFSTWGCELFPNEDEAREVFG